jgi:hypothetical protein
MWNLGKKTANNNNNKKKLQVAPPLCSSGRNGKIKNK